MLRFDFCVTFSDFEKPEIHNMPAEITKGTDRGLPTAIISWMEPNASDNSGSQTLTSSHSPGSSFSIGVTAVEYTAIDLNGNVGNSTFIVNIEGKVAC